MLKNYSPGNFQSRGAFCGVCHEPRPRTLVGWWEDVTHSPVFRSISGPAFWVIRYALWFTVTCSRIDKCPILPRQQLMFVCFVTSSWRRVGLVYKRAYCTCRELTHQTWTVYTNSKHQQFKPGGVFQTLMRRLAWSFGNLLPNRAPTAETATTFLDRFQLGAGGGLEVSIRRLLDYDVKFVWH